MIKIFSMNARFIPNTQLMTIPCTGKILSIKFVYGSLLETTKLTISNDFNQEIIKLEGNKDFSISPRNFVHDNLGNQITYNGTNPIVDYFFVQKELRILFENAGENAFSSLEILYETESNTNSNFGYTPFVIEHSQ